MKREGILLSVVACLLMASNLVTTAQSVSKYIVVDQFGYLPQSKKIAVIRDPQTGFDVAESFTPGSTYAVFNVSTQSQVFSAAPVAWNSGAEDATSGDKVWWFDFSSVTEAGSYYILDVDNNVRSYQFDISPEVYNDVLKHAVRTFFYQRSGFAKEAQYAGTGWADGASHIGSLQDKNARVYNKSGDASTEVDVHGGWYDAGDYNKYTNWTANYIVDFMHAYLENPGAWGDDYNIPESGNNIPDLLDEAKWGIDFLLRMQRNDGAMYSIVGVSHASPPSSATGQSLYGTPNTSGTLNSAAAFAIASKVYGSRGMTDYADVLKVSAVKAWDWAVANPSVKFYNNDGTYGTSGLGAGQQETDDYGRLMAKLEAACFLFEVTGDTKYRDFFDANYQNSGLVKYTFAYPFETTNQEILLYYTTIEGATTSVVNQIRTVYNNAMTNGSENFVAYYADKDPYLAHLKDYTWGSNGVKAANGLMFTDMVQYDIDASKDTDAMDAGLGFIHYIHGVNPLSMLYLSNMYNYGGENCVNEFYHSWFTNGSALWDRVGVSTYGPPPGFVTGGANPSYDWDGCCPSGCGGSENNAVCVSESITPPKGQPAQKSYKDFNTSWPLNSWSVTENSCGYQINYIRLLSKYVNASYDCSGTKNGTAYQDVCGRCVGGTTGLDPISDPEKCVVVTEVSHDLKGEFTFSPNPTSGLVEIETSLSGKYEVTVISIKGERIQNKMADGNASVDLGTQAAGHYFVLVKKGTSTLLEKIVKY